ncbi:hypothetical protein [Marinobacter sp. LN3S78]|uniref:hypothetical protein n=1 Tax=Marinobacter sp. LN3S78 TaxID=3382300 RepID=UPI00387B6205
MTRWFGGRCVPLVMLLLVLVPFATAEAQNDDRLNRVDPEVGFSSVERDYADMDARYAREGVQRDIAQVRRIAIGQSQDALQGALGPAAVEHDDGSFEYHLSLPLTRQDRLICQYRVFFDDQDKVASAVWRRPQCADLVLEPPQ